MFIIINRLSVTLKGVKNGKLVAIGFALAVVAWLTKNSLDL